MFRLLAFPAPLTLHSAGSCAPAPLCKSRIVEAVRAAHHAAQVQALSVAMKLPKPYRGRGRYSSRTTWRGISLHGPCSSIGRFRISRGRTREADRMIAVLGVVPPTLKRPLSAARLAYSWADVQEQQNRVATVVL